MDSIYEVLYVPPVRELYLFASMDRQEPAMWTKSVDELPPKIKRKESSRAGR